MDAVASTAQNAGLALTWPEFRLRCLDLARKIDFSPFDSIFAVPTSGVCVGVELSSFSGLPLVWEPSEKTLVVDDVCDSGRTFERWPNAPVRAALFDKGRAPRSIAPNYVGETVSGWVAFPWETTKKIESTVVRQLEFLGENPNREGLRETPERVRKSWATLYGGYGENPKEILSKRFSVDRPDAETAPIVLKDVEFYSTCEHHMLPFFGEISVGYLPGSRVVGVSKLARLVDCFARRLQIQERLVEEIASAIQEELAPRGVYVRAEAQHFCMVARGVQKRRGKMVTVATRGDAETIRRVVEAG